MFFVLMDMAKLVRKQSQRLMTTTNQDRVPKGDADHARTEQPCLQGGHSEAWVLRQGKAINDGDADQFRSLNSNGPRDCNASFIERDSVEPGFECASRVIYATLCRSSPMNSIAYVDLDTSDRERGGQVSRFEAVSTAGINEKARRQDTDGISMEIRTPDDD